jgi:lipopolysaccharide transport system ATP-binding protein
MNYGTNTTGERQPDLQSAPTRPDHLEGVPSPADVPAVGESLPQSPSASRCDIGIIGHNGAGKSTLLKLLAGVYPPSKGALTVEGKISSLFELSLGFEHDASGWENIFYRGYLQGETPKSVRAKMQGIADFSELGDFLNMPVRYYSAGMLVRLAFSIATAIDPEILLVDEVLGAGDMAFQAKARQRMCDMMSKARLIVMVSHDMDALAKLCESGIWMDHGQVRRQGPIHEVIAAYTDSVQAGQSRAA